MKKFMSALLAATFLVGLSIEDVDAKARHKHHNYTWHKGKHYTQLQRKHRRASLPPVVVARIHIASQQMSVDVNGYHYGDWLISTAGNGYTTPQGTFGATKLSRTYYSRKYDNSPMPYSVFFSGGNAIHGTSHLHSLGHPASHGCVRLHPDNAAKLFSLVEQYGMGRTRIVVSN